MMTTRVLVVASTMPEAALEKVARQCEVIRWDKRELPSVDELRRALAGVSGLLTDNRVALPEGLLAETPDLQWVSLIGAGFSNVDLCAARERGVVVMNTPGVMASAVAELAIGLLICLTRDIVGEATRVRARSWSSVEAERLGRGLEGLRLGIVGFGACGTAVASRARAFGIEVAYSDPAVTQQPPRRCELDELLGWADAVSLHAELNPSTHRLIGERELRLMRSGSYLLNLGRGALVDPEALADSVRSGHLAGAALDVLEVEPPPPGEPLLDLPNVVVVPHIGAATVSARNRMFALAVDNALAAMAGSPQHVVSGR